MLDSGSGLANATLQQRLVLVRLFYDFLGEEGVRVQSGRPRPLAVEWFRGINSVLGVERTGIYGHSDACGWAIKDGVIGSSTTAGFRWAWRTKAWSHGEREPMAVLYQEVVNSPSRPGPLLGGINVDVDEVLATDFGQWDFDR